MQLIFTASNILLLRNKRHYRAYGDADPDRRREQFQEKANTRGPTTETCWWHDGERKAASQKVLVCDPITGQQYQHSKPSSLSLLLVWWNRNQLHGYMSGEYGGWGTVAPHSWYLWGINLEQNTWFIACWSRGTLGKAHRQWHHIIHRYCMAKQFGLMHSCTDSCAVAHVPVCCWTATMLLTKAWALAVWQVMKADNKKKTTNQELDVASNHVY